MLLPLHIFEHRYRLLVARAMERSEPFGVALIKSGLEVGAAAEPYGIGTTARIVQHEQQPDGRSLLVARGERRFAIDEVRADDEPYLVAMVHWLDEPTGTDAVSAATTASDAYREYLAAAGAVLQASGQEAPAAVSDEGGPVDL